MEYHPAANIFPLLGKDELTSLAGDIKANGLNQPIVTHEGKILDGRNRFRACEIAGVPPRFEAWKNGTSPTVWVISQNLHRRHLTDSQKAAVGVDVDALLSKETPRGRPSKNEPKKRLIPGKSAAAAGRAMGVSRAYIETAKQIGRKSPALLAQVKEGAKTLTEAKREIRRGEASSRAATLPKGKFRVLYADPPWKYGDSREALDGTTGASAHYPTMSIAQLCDMPITDSVADDAVLFLWVTSPLLFECAPVIKAWGFTYKTSFVWDKIKHNMGHYNSVRHEFLLVCTRGSCTPDVSKLFDSVQSIERTKHSEKPEVFREIIETLYPHGSRLELFARKKVEGWDAYGNEC